MKKTTTILQPGRARDAVYRSPLAEIIEVSVEKGFGDSIPVGDYEDRDA